MRGHGELTFLIIYHLFQLNYSIYLIMHFSPSENLSNWQVFYQSLHALFAFAKTANAYAQLAVFYAHLCGLYPHMRPFLNAYWQPFKINHIRGKLDLHEQIPITSISSKAFYIIVFCSKIPAKSFFFTEQIFSCLTSEGILHLLPFFYEYHDSELST